MGKVRFGQASLGYHRRTFDYRRKTLVPYLEVSWCSYNPLDVAVAAVADDAVT